MRRRSVQDVYKRQGIMVASGRWVARMRWIPNARPSRAIVASLLSICASNSLSPLLRPVLSSTSTTSSQPNTSRGRFSPVAVSYTHLSQIFELNFGDMTFVLYGIFVVVQLFLRERRERLATLLQFPLSLVFSRLLNLCSACIPYQAAAHSLPENLAVLALAIVLTGVGVALTVNMRLVPNPGDGIVQAVAQRMGWDQGFAKNVFDLGCVARCV